MKPKPMFEVLCDAYLRFYSHLAPVEHREFVRELYQFCKKVLKAFPYHELARLNFAYHKNDGGWYGFERKEHKKVAEIYEIVTWFTIERCHELDTENANKKFIFTEQDRKILRRVKQLQPFAEKWIENADIYD